jgi:hypothetical protein
VACDAVKGAAGVDGQDFADIEAYGVELALYSLTTSYSFRSDGRRHLPRNRSYPAWAGGGIISTVKATRAASEDGLVAATLPRLDCLLAEGVTTGAGLARAGLAPIVLGPKEGLTAWLKPAATAALNRSTSEAGVFLSMNQARPASRHATAADPNWRMVIWPTPVCVR